MSKLKIVYSHEKELQIAGDKSSKLASFGVDKTKFEMPAVEQDALEIASKLERAWEPKEDKFIKKLNWFYGTDFKIEGWTAYLVRLPFCPYNPDKKWLAVYLNRPVEDQVRVIGHEFFHQPFHLYWWKRCEEIFGVNQGQKTSQKFQKGSVVDSLKEALPELLNTPEFRISEGIEKGKTEPGEQFIRHLIRKYYKEHGPFTFKDFLEWIS